MLIQSNSAGRSLGATTNKPADNNKGATRASNFAAAAKPLGDSATIAPKSEAPAKTEPSNQGATMSDAQRQAKGDIGADDHEKGGRGDSEPGKDVSGNPTAAAQSGGTVAGAASAGTQPAKPVNTVSQAVDKPAPVFDRALREKYQSADVSFQNEDRPLAATNFGDPPNLGKFDSRYSQTSTLPKYVRNFQDAENVKFGKNVIVPNGMIKSYQQVREHMMSTTEGQQYLSAFENSPNKVTFTNKDGVGNQFLETKGRTTSIGDKFDTFRSTEGEINWNPKKAGMTYTGGSLSPATFAAHEIAHAVNDLNPTNPGYLIYKDDKGNYLTDEHGIGKAQEFDGKGTPMGKFTNVEENRVINGLERNLAIANGEAPRDSHHMAGYYDVSNSRSIEATDPKVQKLLDAKNPALKAFTADLHANGGSPDWGSKFTTADLDKVLNAANDPTALLASKAKDPAKRTPQDLANIRLLSETKDQSLLDLYRDPEFRNMVASDNVSQNFFEKRRDAFAQTARDGLKAIKENKPVSSPGFNDYLNDERQPGSASANKAIADSANEATGAAKARGATEAAAVSAGANAASSTAAKIAGTAFKALGPVGAVAGSAIGIGFNAKELVDAEKSGDQERIKAAKITLAADIFTGGFYSIFKGFADALQHNTGYQPDFDPNSDAGILNQTPMERAALI